MAEALFVQLDPHTFEATALTRGPWDEGAQHGGPPSALLAGALERFDGGDDFAVTRVVVDFRRGVPIDRLTVDVEPQHLGRTVQRLRATLSHEGRIVLEAQALRIRRREAPVADPPIADWPAPESVEPHIFGFFSHPVGYHRAVDVRFVNAPWGTTPVQVWGRLRVPLVEGRTSTALERVVPLADAQSGMGPPLDPLRYNYANPDLAVFLDRMPQGDWIGFDIRSSAQPGGIGLSQALIRDPVGAIGRCAQALVITERQDG